MFDFLPTSSKPWIHSFYSLQIPKTASSSIAKVCGERNLIQKHQSSINKRFGSHPLYRGVFDTRHLIPEHCFQVFGQQVFDFFSFAVVRHPADRILSSYYFGRDKKLWTVYGLPEATTLDEYVDFLWKNRSKKDVLILLPQTIWTHSIFFRPQILRFESLANDWNNMLLTHDIKGLPSELPHENKSKHKDWREEFSKESLKKILDLFQDDYKLLQYDN
jgi:hypothetical protein